MLDLRHVNIETPRLRLRGVRQEDFESYCEMRKDKELFRYFAYPAQESLEVMEPEFKRLLEPCADMAICLRESDEFIGKISYHNVSVQNQRCEIGYLLATPFQGKGLMFEAAEAFINYAFNELNMNRIEADIDPRNVASRKLLERLRFQKEGHMPERWIVDNEVSDTDFYGLLKKNW